jgi:hypothetical protein
MDVLEARMYSPRHILFCAHHGETMDLKVPVSEN